MRFELASQVALAVQAAQAAATSSQVDAGTACKCLNAFIITAKNLFKTWFAFSSFCQHFPALAAAAAQSASIAQVYIAQMFTIIRF